MFRYFIFVLGCQQNVLDAEKIEPELKKLGGKKVNEGSADLIVVLACSVRQSAVNRIWGRLKRWQNKKILILACVLPVDKKKLAERVDLILSSEDFLKNPKRYLGKLGLCPKYKILNTKYNKSAASGFVAIQLGCDNFCTYCAVPYTRGRERSIPQNVILSETKKLARQGVTNITLLGENVNSYKPSFVKLLEKIEKIDGVKTINFLTSNPQDFGDDLINWLKNSKKWNHQLHLALQSGDDEILKKMNRRYSSGQFLELIEKIKTRCTPRQCTIFSPRSTCTLRQCTNGGLKLSTDIIVGFPTETKKQFENTIKLCKKIGFSKAYISQYSPRPGTAAAKLYRDDIPTAEKKRRWKILNKMINKEDYASLSAIKKATNP